MSLEAALAANTAALEAHTAAVQKNNELMIDAAAGRERAIEAAQAASAGKPKAAAKAAEPKPETPAAAEAKAETPAAAAAPQPDAPLDPVSQSIVDYVDIADEEERTARKAKVAEILGKVGAKNRGEIPADKEEVFINTMKKLLENGNLIQPAAAATDLL